MRKQKYPIQLNEVERLELEAIVRKGQPKARVMRRAQTLLWSDGGKSDLEIAELHGISPLTVAKTRERWVKNHALEDRSRSGRHPKLDGKQEAFLVALACSDAPDGRETWTMQMLADKLVELQVIDEPISDETVRLKLKKRSETLAERTMVYSESR